MIYLPVMPAIKQGIGETTGTQRKREREREICTDGQIGS